MSPKIPVPPLSYLCVKFVSAQLIQALSDDEGLSYQVVAEYLVDATYEVLQDLLKNILNSVNLDAGTRFSCLQVLLREDVKKLDIGIFPHSYYKKILEAITEKGTGLQQLNLKGVWVRDHPELLSELLKSLKKLRVLIIPHMADDTVLSAVFNLKHLVNLDVSGEACFSAGCISKLKSDTIKVLDIGYFGKTNICDQEGSGPELVAEIIQHLPNLSSLRTYSFTGSALLILYSRNKSFRTKLTYLHDTGTTPDAMRAIIQLCPNLESIHIDSAELSVTSMLTHIKKLSCLKLTKPNGDEFMKYLRESGSKLQVLKINHNKNYSLDLSEVCVCAPNLQTFECYLMKITFSDPETYFMSLQNAELLYCDMSDSVFKFVLCNSPFLKRTIIGCAIHMTDGDIFRLCAEYDFIFLEELWISCARSLTATSLELLMKHCPNLKVMGQLSGWDVHSEEIEYLRAIIATTNTDLALLPLEAL